MNGEIITENVDVALVPIDIERDAPKGVEWLAGASGRETLGLMGVTEANNRPSDLDSERKRLREIIANPNKDAWMIRYGSDIIGIVEIDKADKEYIKAPAISIMIGDPAARGKGIGTSCIASALDYLLKIGYIKAYARHLTDNEASAGMLAGCGFIDDGEVYDDNDGLQWQNMKKEYEDEV